MHTNMKIWLMAVGWFCLIGAIGLAQENKAAQEEMVPAVVAKVNGKAIKGAEYKKLRHQIEMERRSARGVQDPKAREGMKQDILERLIVVELLNQKAYQMKVKVDPKELARKLQEIEKRVGGKEALDAALQANGLTREQYLADMEKSLMIQNLLQREVFSKITVEEHEIKAFYDSRPQGFKVSEQVRARHIVIRVAKDATEAQRKESMAAIDKAAARIQKGETFEAVAKEVSEDGAAASGGDLGYFSRGKMVPEFEKVAFSLEKGQVSQMVETHFGFHLIKVEDKRPPRTLPFEEVRPRIMDYLERKKKTDAARGYIDGLKAKANIEKVVF